MALKPLRKQDLRFQITFARQPYKIIATTAAVFTSAVYINSFTRPEKENKIADFPDRNLKPMSTPYGPWSDSFPADQHKYGPYGEIAAFYKAEYNLNKSK
ncbi:MAG: hypothetical protein ISP75_01085 [Cryomorphaceae bacterium]|nr:hypothetical protein [Cryomorphaceae bacterium]